MKAGHPKTIVMHGLDPRIHGAAGRGQLDGLRVKPRQ